MRLKRLACLPLLLVFFAFPVFPSTISLLLVETGINDNVSNIHHTAIWEEALLGAFFDNGYIVTSSPTLRMERRPARDLTGTIARDFDEAVLGGVDYFVLAYLEYRIGSGGRAFPVGINIRVYSTETRSLIFEQDFPAGSGRNNNEEIELANSTGHTIVSRLRTGR